MDCFLIRGVIVFCLVVRAGFNVYLFGIVMGSCNGLSILFYDGFDWYLRALFLKILFDFIL